MALRSVSKWTNYLVRSITNVQQKRNMRAARYDPHVLSKGRVKRNVRSVVNKIIADTAIAQLGYNKTLSAPHLRELHQHTRRLLSIFYDSSPKGKSANMQIPKVMAEIEKLVKPEDMRRYCSTLIELRKLAIEKAEVEIEERQKETGHE